ncbi:pyridoxamine 5'-phosphate oxidase [Empedobacter brevis]|uniref:Pyridoxine/pyridoxamine 5'-phosphate oxidase n=1 Tax=Empedobacter brevis NBRC 14943 = ATCC 43319 TaxID=1218108 RepID=A0A511NF00_9FLAO|nr:pyridoxamine 5'-phosphate oxidase [Empedobacter brevis]QES93855.1 pyridoxamine 5'-phosphate oxidase [Empedobacter brevis]GEM51382.1 pyridoxine/pyridoxamine 5'-phosphate oxidase [Empedobacter brevis NBRC 14943 = ATCC 43319]
MKQDLSYKRKVYEKQSMNFDSLRENPIEQFRDWFLQAENSDGVDEANAMSVATIGEDGFPRTRVVLLKKYTEEGFIFYTNYNSQKGKALLENPKVCLSFFWPFLERQIIIKGVAEKTSANNSDGYFETRPRSSQLGAWISAQSSVIDEHQDLAAEELVFEKKYEGKEIPRPDHWGGFLVRPTEIEFWQGRPSRLHDRFRYVLQEDFDWKKERLAP